MQERVSTSEPPSRKTDPVETGGDHRANHRKANLASVQVAGQDQRDATPTGPANGVGGVRKKQAERVLAGKVLQRLQRPKPGNLGSRQQQLALLVAEKMLPAGQVGQSAAGQFLPQQIGIRMPGIVIPQDIVDTQPGLQATQRLRKPLSAVVVIENISAQADQVGGKLVYLITEGLVKLLSHLA